MSYFDSLFFGIYPYIALLVCLVASVIRYDKDQYSWKSGSSQLLRNTNMRRDSNMFHVGIIFILLGHLVGLLTPEAIYHNFISSSAKQVVAMSMGGIFGVICLIGMTGLLKRRLFDPRIRASSTRSDIAILIMLYVQLILGLISIFFSMGHMDGSVMVLLATWAQSIVTFQFEQAVNAISTVDLIFKLHIFLGLTIVLMFPFSRLVHVASVPIKYVGRNYQIVRQKQH